MTLYLADAAALVNFYIGHSAFPPALRALLEHDTSRVAVAATTILEIELKARRRVIPAITGQGDLARMLERQGYTLLTLDGPTAASTAFVGPPELDLFVKALIAVARQSGRTVLTRNSDVIAAGVPTNWSLVETATTASTIA